LAEIEINCLESKDKDFEVDDGNSEPMEEDSDLEDAHLENSKLEEKKSMPSTLNKVTVLNQH